MWCCFTKQVQVEDESYHGAVPCKLSVILRSAVPPNGEGNVVNRSDD